MDIIDVRTTPDSTLDVKTTPSPILILAPHPDDDILGSGGLIQKALKLNKRIYVLYVTNGDANTESVTDYLHMPLVPKSYRDLGYLRHAEAVHAERFLRVPSSHLFFMGFPDSIMYEIATDTSLSRIHRSPYTNFTRAAYPFSYRVNAPYTHASALNIMESVMRKVKPKTVVVNLGIDIHPDHKATRLLALEAIKKLHIRTRIYSYLVHYPNWPRGTRGPLIPPVGVHIPGLVSLPLTPREEQRTREAYTIHLSQSTLIPNNYNLIRRNELFWISSTDKIRVCTKAHHRSRYRRLLKRYRTKMKSIKSFGRPHIGGI